MKTGLFLVIIILLPLSSLAHPGKTDYRGGHKCWRHCDEWELLSGEYHLHDKDGKPVRISKKESALEIVGPKEAPTPEKRFLLEGPSVPSTPVPGHNDNKIAEKGPVAGTPQSVTVYEENLLSFRSVLLGLLAFLLLVVLVFVRKKRERD